MQKKDLFKDLVIQQVNNNIKINQNITPQIQQKPKSLSLENILSYSMYLTNYSSSTTKKQTNTTQVTNKIISECKLPRKNYSWVDDNTVLNCYNCSIVFNIFTRRHHCRMCGKIFCHECSKYSQEIPENLLSANMLDKTWTTYYNNNANTRLCCSCNNTISTISSIKSTIELFKLLNLDILSLKKIGQISKLYNTSSNYLLSNFREIQYKLATDVYTQEEVNLLKLNSKYFCSHSKYILCLLKIAETQDEILNIYKTLIEPKVIPCKLLMCTRSCQNKLSSTDSINLLAYAFKTLKFTETYKKIALENLICSDQELKCYITFLVYNLRYDQDVLCNWLLKRCVNNGDLLTCLYWEINYYITSNSNNVLYTNILNKLINFLSNDKYKNKYNNLLQQSTFNNLIEDIASKIANNVTCEDLKDKYNLESSLYTPLSSIHKVTKIQVQNIKIKDSISRPLIIPCDTVTLSNIVSNNNTNFKIMYKLEDLRKDQIILNIINLMEVLLKKEENIDLNIVNYNIVPTGVNKGLIEIVDNADTLYYIQQTIKSNILNYILEKNGNSKILDIKEKFIRSTAAYCVLTYLLGIGDRHLDNIMVTRDGRLFHIDYSFILGKDPVFNDPSIRITPEIIDAIGGLSSTSYVYFKEMCTKIYNNMRRNIDIFLNLILQLKNITNIDQTEQEIITQIIKRFIPGENDLDAQLHLVHKLESSSITDKIKDFFHYHNKEKTLSSSLGRLTTAVSGLWVSKN